MNITTGAAITEAEMVAVFGPDTLKDIKRVAVAYDTTREFILVYFVDFEHGGLWCVDTLRSKLWKWNGWWAEDCGTFAEVINDGPKLRFNKQCFLFDIESDV